MVASISTKNLNSLLTSNKPNTLTNTNKVENLGDIEDSIETSSSQSIKSKDDLFISCMRSNVSSIEDFSQFCSNAGVKSSDSAVKSLYSQYMQSRGCDSQSELDELTSFSKDFGCPVTKDFMLKMASSNITSTVDNINQSSGISISNEQISSIVSNSSIRNLGKYLNSEGTTISDSVSNFQTLIKNISKQENINDTFRNSLSEISKEISDKSDYINKWSDKIAKENVMQEAQRNNKKYNASLISNYNN